MIKLFFRRLFLLNKRFLKMPLFVGLLCFIPLCLFFITSTNITENSNPIIAINIPDDATNFTKEVANKLFDYDGLFKFESYFFEEEILAGVESGKFFTGFIFPKDLESLFQSFEKGRPKGKIKVFVKSENIITRLIREETFALIYSDISKIILQSYLNRTDDNILSNPKYNSFIKNCYEFYQTDTSIFKVQRFVKNPEIYEVEKKSISENFLPLPVRGLTAIFVFLIGLAASFYFIRDKKNSLFLWVPISKLKFFRLAYIMIPVFDAGLVMLFSLRFSPTFSSWHKEIFLMIPFIFSVGTFCSFLCAVFDDEALLASFIPILTIASLILCPIFINTKVLIFLQVILPPYFYLSSQNSISIWLFIYPIIAFLLSEIFSRVRDVL